MEKTENVLDKNKISSSRKALKRDFSIFIGNFITMLVFTVAIMLLKNTFISNIIAVLYLICGIAEIIFYLIILFRIRYVYRALGKSLTTITLFQLGYIFIPLGIFIFPAIVLEKSK